MTDVAYLEVLPRPELRPFVRVFWSLRGPPDPGGGVDRIVPDGCPEIVLNRADPFRRFTADGPSREQARVLLVGQLSRALEIVPTGTVDLLGVRFEPGGLFALLGTPMHELTDVDVALRQLAPDLRDALVDAAREQDLGLAVAGLEHALLDGLARRGRPAPGHAGLAGAAVALVQRGALDVGDLAAGLGLGRRALERLFRREVGLSPKLYARIERLQGVLAGLESGAPADGWARLARRHGYADQSHLIRDFRLLAGTTPRRHVAERSDLATCFESRDPSHPSNP